MVIKSNKAAFPSIHNPNNPLNYLPGPNKQFLPLSLSSNTAKYVENFLK